MVKITQKALFSELFYFDTELNTTYFILHNNSLKLQK